MTLKIEKKIISYLGKTFGRQNKKLYVTIHQSGAPGAYWNADAMHNYLVQMATPSNPEQKSWHYSVDDKKAIQSYDHNVSCWASGDGRGNGNMHSIQIEACINRGSNYVQTIHNLVELVAKICLDENISPYTNIRTHKDWSGKWCPAQILNGQAGYTLPKVKSMIIAKYEEMKRGGKVINDNNPQNLPETAPMKYEAPTFPFDRHKVGDTVTIAEGDWKWFDPVGNKLLTSKRQKELAGTKDKVVQVLEVNPVQKSKYVYKLENYNSWILEEYLVESMDSWEKIEEAPGYIDGYDEGIGNYLYFNGVKYKVVEFEE